MATSRLNRPISPHLTAYNMFRITSLLSILNRATGFGIGFGLLFMILWLGAAAYGPDAYAAVMPFLTSWFAWLVYLGVSGSLFYHYWNGIRFMIWDMGYGFELPMVVKGGIVMALMTAATFALFWAMAVSLL